MRTKNPTALRAIKAIHSHSMMKSTVVVARASSSRKLFASVKDITTKVALLDRAGRRYRVSRMKTDSTAEAAANPMQRYPRGRWSSPSARLATSDRLGALLRSLNADDSALLADATERLTAILEAAAVRPPFMTAMDYPMPEAA